jgi:hypothetical protein
MERKPDPRDEEPLTEENLKSLQRHLSMLSSSSVEDFYNTAHKECCLGNKRLPAPRAIQQLVTAWKQLWKWKRMGGR